MPNTNKYTIIRKKVHYDVRDMTTSEMRALRDLLSLDIDGIEGQVTGTNYADNKWRQKAKQAAEIKHIDINKINRAIQGRADNEEEYAYTSGIVDLTGIDIRKVIEESLQDIVPDEVITLVTDRALAEIYNLHGET